MDSKELRRRFIDFFATKHGHREIPGSSLIPENDPTVLFTTAGMHPLVPYLMGEAHPEGRRLVDVQKCVRTDDIDEVGDLTHCTFFEMLGNWSLGDYFKEEAIRMSYAFLTTPLEEGGLGLDPDRLAVSCFAGDKDAPRDEEAAKVWESLGFVRAETASDAQKRRIFFYGKKDNWWGPAGQTGPCGPDTEMFYFTGSDLTQMWETEPSDDITPWVEIWNDVFMQYNKNADGSFNSLSQQNVDTGMGLERVTAILQGKASHYETDLFASVMQTIESLAQNSDPLSIRIIADHLRAVTFIMGDERGVTPGNGDQAYIVRRLIRRAIRHGRKLGIQNAFTVEIARAFIEQYASVYPELKKHESRIVSALEKEEEQFQKTLAAGEQELEKDTERVSTALSTLSRSSQVSDLERSLNALSQIISAKDLLSTLNQKLRPKLAQMRAQFKEDAAKQALAEPDLLDIRQAIESFSNEAWVLRGDRAFYYFETFGFPLEMTEEMMREKGLSVDQEAFQKAFQAHQEKSRTGAEQKFAGGLADHSFETRRLHTATHLMLEALRRVLGKEVEQRGSNITADRLRFDFNYSEKMTPEQLTEVERIVNDAIQADYPVSFKEMTVEEARALDATGIFVDKYEGELGGRVKVYFMGDFSKEICGGPHVEHTGQLGGCFKIQKEESSSAGVRRIKAVLIA